MARCFHSNKPDWHITHKRGWMDGCRYWWYKRIADLLPIPTNIHTLTHNLRMHDLGVGCRQATRHAPCSSARTGMNSGAPAEFQDGLMWKPPKLCRHHHERAARRLPARETICQQSPKEKETTVAKSHAQSICSPIYPNSANPSLNRNPTHLLPE